MVNEQEKIYKTLGSTGAGNIAVGIVVLVTGIAVGVLTLVNGDRLLKRRKDIIL